MATDTSKGLSPPHLEYFIVYEDDAGQHNTSVTLERPVTSMRDVAGIEREIALKIAPGAGHITVTSYTLLRTHAQPYAPVTAKELPASVHRHQRRR